MTIRTIIFDFGGVLYRTPNLQRINRWKKLFGLDDNPELRELLADPNESQLVKDICLGKIPEDTIWTLMTKKWHLKPRLINKIRSRMVSKRSLNKKIFRFMAELSEKYQTAILSNAGDHTRSLMEDVFHFDDYVEDIIISAEEGVIKPDPRIFELTMERLDTTPLESLFIDDYLVNVLAAREFGMHAVQFVNNQQAIQAVRDALRGGT